MTVSVGGPVSLRDNYALQRRKGKTPAESIAAAREMKTDSGIAGYSFFDYGESNIGGPFAPGDGSGKAGRCRWFEVPENFGFRFVGFADEISKRHESRTVDHTGWYDEPDGDGELYRGAVYQLPSRGGRALYVAGYRHGSESRKSGGNWIDCAYQDSAVIECMGFADVFEGESGGSGSYSDRQAMLDCAQRADRLAELTAESERDYRQAWNLGTDWRRHHYSAIEARKEGLTLAAEFKAARAAAIKAGLELPALCDRLRRDILAAWDTVREEREARDRIVAESYFDKETKSAFLEGAELSAMPS